MQIIDATPLFYDESGVGYAEIASDGLKKIVPIQDHGFENWLLSEYYKLHSDFPTPSAVKSCMSLAVYRSKSQKCLGSVFLRFGENSSKHYVDLASKTGEVVEIDDIGWRILQKSPIAFRHTSIQREIVTPRPRGDVTRFLDFVNVEAEEHKILLLSALCATPLADIAKPIIGFIGQQGSAKTSAARFFRMLVDPSEPLVNDYRPDRRELSLVFYHNALPVFDNLSTIPLAMSNMLCAAVTGAGYQTRAQYTNAGIFAYSYKRGMLFTSLGIPTKAPDFLDRSLFIEMNRITTTRRRSETALVEAFQAATPDILGGILDTLVEAKRYLTCASLPSLPRLADFGRYGAAISEVLGFGAKRFFEAYHANGSSQGLAAVRNSDPVLAAIVKLIEQVYCFTGLTSELLEVLNEFSPVNLKPGQRWPTNPIQMGKALFRLNADLLDCGIEMEFEPTRRGKLIRISKKAEDFALEGKDKEIFDLLSSLNDADDCDGKHEPYRTNMDMWDIDGEDVDEELD